MKDCLSSLKIPCFHIKSSWQGSAGLWITVPKSVLNNLGSIWYHSETSEVHSSAKAVTYYEWPKMKRDARLFKSCIFPEKKTALRRLYSFSAVHCTLQYGFSPLHQPVSNRWKLFWEIQCFKAVLKSTPSKRIWPHCVVAYALMSEGLKPA